jgi:hypothetical protein
LIDRTKDRQKCSTSGCGRIYVLPKRHNLKRDANGEWSKGNKQADNSGFKSGGAPELIEMYGHATDTSKPYKKWSGVVNGRVSKNTAKMIKDSTGLTMQLKQKPLRSSKWSSSLLPQAQVMLTALPP